MKRMLCALAGVLLLSGPAWAGAPTTADVMRDGGVLTIHLKGTTTGASGIDTVYVDIRAADWGTVVSNAYGLDVSILNNSTAGDSVTVIYASAFKGNVVGATVGAVTVSNINGQDDGAAGNALTQISPFMYITVADGDATRATVTYDVFLYTKSAR